MGEHPVRRLVERRELEYTKGALQLRFEDLPCGSRTFLWSVIKVRDTSSYVPSRCSQAPAWLQTSRPGIIYSLLSFCFKYNYEKKTYTMPLMPTRKASGPSPSFTLYNFPNVPTRRAGECQRSSFQSPIIHLLPNMMFINGKVTPVHIEARVARRRRTLSLYVEYAKIL